MALIGYARVSTADQSLDLQIDALKKAGCERVFAEKASGKSGSKRPEFDKCMEYLRPGDVLVIWKLDRLGRNVKNLLSFAEDLNQRNIGMKIITMDIDTTTAAGRLMYTILAGLAEMERDLIVERTKAGLEAARARGRIGGRKQIESDVLDRAFMMYDNNIPVKEICKLLPIEKSAFYWHKNERDKRLAKEQEEGESS